MMSWVIKKLNLFLQKNDTNILLSDEWDIKIFHFPH